MTFKVISRDAGLDVEDLRAAMCDREVWQDVVPGISAEAEGWWWWIANKKIMLIENNTKRNWIYNIKQEKKEKGEHLE